MTLQEEIDLDRDYKRVSREHRRQRAEYWQERFALAVAITAPKPRIVAPEPVVPAPSSKTVSYSSPIKCLECSEMVCRPRLRCPSCARVKKVAQNRSGRTRVRVDKPREIAQNESGGAADHRG
jgi:hypothetical protein